MKQTFLFLIVFVGVCCSSTGLLYEEVREEVSANPWNCSVVIEAFIPVPDDGKITKPGTVLLTKDPVTSLIRARGTGTVIKIQGNELTILTAKHVVEDALNVFVGRYGVTALGYGEVLSEDHDLAIFKVRDATLAKKLMVAPLSLNVPRPGARLDVVGNALGLGLRWMGPGPMASDIPLVVKGSNCWLGCYHSYPGCSGASIWHDGKVVGVVSMVMMAQSGTVRVPLPDLGIFVGAESIHEFLQK